MAAVLQRDLGSRTGTSASSPDLSGRCYRCYRTTGMRPHSLLGPVVLLENLCLWLTTTTTQSTHLAVVLPAQASHTSPRIRPAITAPKFPSPIALLSNDAPAVAYHCIVIRIVKKLHGQNTGKLVSERYKSIQNIS